MISLLPLGRVVRLIACVYAAMVIGLMLVLQHGRGPASFWSSLSWAFAGGTALQLLLLGWVTLGWRWLWRKIPQLNVLLYPDLGGHWAMEIHWNRDGHAGVVHGTALIRQDFLRMSMDVSAIDSDSQTLTVQPKKDPESGRATLFYIYLVTPHGTRGQDGQPYRGAAILKPELTNPDELRGNYWTDVQSSGHFILRRKASAA